MDPRLRGLLQQPTAIMGMDQQQQQGGGLEGLLGNLGQPILSQQKPTQTEREALQAREKQYYIDHPQSSLELTPTEFTSPYGMPVYKDQFGMNHSESTDTFKLPDGRWTTAPMIWPDPQTGKARYFTRPETIEFLGGHGWSNPITGEKIPMFGSEPEASSWAVDRDMTLQDKNLPFNRR